MTYHSHADVGGRVDSTPVQPEPEGAVFHAPWERRILALTLAMGATGLWNLDKSRSTRETLENYAHLDYYGIWMEALDKLLLATHAVLPEELTLGAALQPPIPVPRVLRADAVAQVLARGAATLRHALMPARFAVGDKVRTLGPAPPHHTRLPAYARAKHGIVERVHGAHVFADSNAQGLGERPQWLYTVVFSAEELWGPRAATAPHHVSVDAWEPYLEPA